MKADKFLDALNYIDDDLISDCDKVREGASLSTSGKKKMSRARVTAMWGSIAAAAVVLVVGFFVINLNKESDKSSHSKSHHNTMNKSEDKADRIEEMQTVAGVNEFPENNAMIKDADSAEEAFSPNLYRFTGIRAEIADMDLKVTGDVADETEFVDCISNIISGDGSDISVDGKVCCLMTFYNDNESIDFEVIYTGSEYFLCFIESDDEVKSYSITKNQAMKIRSFIQEME